MELGLRFNIVVDLSRGNSYERILQVEIGLPRFLCLPYGVQALATDAAGQVGMKLSRGISNAANGCLSVLGALTRNQGGWSGTSILGSPLAKAASTCRSAVVLGCAGMMLRTGREHSGIGGVGDGSRSDNGKMNRLRSRPGHEAFAV
jgi:hypothetical protein